MKNLEGWGDFSGAGPILYITEYFSNNFYYVSTAYDPEEICEKIWAFQKGMLDFAKTHPDYQFIIKLHPATPPNDLVRIYVHDQNIRNIKIIVNEQSLPELIQRARVIVVDFIATSILEAVVSSKPVFTYSGLYKIDEKPLRLLQKRSYTFNEGTALVSALDDYLAGNFHVTPERVCLTPPNQEFIEQFGIFKNDFMSAKRASALLEKVLSDCPQASER